ncbi:MAG TPA: hypothetical protein DHW02_08575, partial [Ktedonobacter sp.]|nr:hypothetical protein [Ktedonobacter sp.]
MERTFEQRLHSVKRDVDQRLMSIQQEITRTLLQSFGEQNRKLRGMLGELVLATDEDIVDSVDDDEVETEIDFDDLSEVIRHVLDERLQVLGDLRDVFKNIEQ